MTPVRVRRSWRSLAIACGGILAMAPSAWGLASPTTYNPVMAPTQSGVAVYECIAPATASVPMWFFSDVVSAYSWRSLSWSVQEDGSTTCPANQLRVSRWEKLTIDNKASYVMRGGGGTSPYDPYRKDYVRTGHVLAASLAKQTSLITQYKPAYAGAAVACGGPLYRNKPERGSAGMYGLYYKPKSGSSWGNYGDQSFGGPDHYNYLLWTLPLKINSTTPNSGGGQARASIKSGQYIRSCDVDATYQKAIPQSGGDPIGDVKWQYGRVNNGAHTIYGWFVIAWRKNGQGWNYLVETATP